MSYAIIKVVDVTHMGLLRQITGNWARRQGDGAWETRLSEEVIQAAGTQLAAKYIIRRQATMVQWVSL